MTYEFHLIERLKYFNRRIFKYINDVVKSENPDLFEKIAKKKEEIMDKLLKKHLGENWKELRKKFPSCFKERYPIPLKLVDERLDSKVKMLHCIRYNNWTESCYPFINGLTCTNIDSQDLIEISDLLIDLELLKYKFATEELIKKGIIDSYGAISEKLTWEDVKLIHPHLLDWEIKELLEEYDKVIIIPKEKDLEDLKDALRS